MSIGERIKRIRNLRGITQKQLGLSAGLGEAYADVRVAQYENGIRTPKKKLVEAFAFVLDVYPDALDIPDIRSSSGLMHTLFELEDQYGLHIDKINSMLCITMDPSRRDPTHSLFHLLNNWHKEYEKLQKGEISKEEYDHWRYNYPRSVAERIRAASIAAHRAKQKEAEQKEAEQKEQE